MAIQQTIRDFLKELLHRAGDDDPFSDDSSLLFSGRLQSIDAIEIAVFLEQNFGVDFAKAGFDQGDLDSVEKIAALVKSPS